MIGWEQLGQPFWITIWIYDYLVQYQRFVYEKLDQFVYVGQNTYFDCDCHIGIHSPFKSSYQTLHFVSIICHLRETCFCVDDLIIILFLKVKRKYSKVFKYGI